MDNPYSSSALDPISHPSGNAITPGVLSALAGTKPWVRFCSIIGFIGTGFMFLAAASMLVMGGTGALNSGNSGFEAIAGGLGIVLAIVYVVLGLLYLVPSIKLWKFGSHIANLLQSNSSDDLEAALNAQRSFWKFVSIMIIIGIVIYILAIIGFVAFSMIGISSSIK